MEAPEVPTDHLHEEIHEHAHMAKERWLSFVALSTALIAALAAITSLMAGKFDTEANIEQLKASDQWAFYQAKGIKSNIAGSEALTVKTKIALLTAFGKPVDPTDEAALANSDEEVKRYKEDQKRIKAKAEGLTDESREHLRRHETLASGVTMFQIAIAIAAISVLTRRRLFFYVSLGISVIGIYFFVLQFIPSAPQTSEDESSAAPPVTAPAHPQ